MNSKNFILSFSALILLLSSCGADPDTNKWVTTSTNQGSLEMVISASGTLQATNTVEVGTQVSGVVQEVLVDFNDVVKAGQVIARLDDRMLHASLQQADAALRQAELQLAQRKRAYQDALRFNSGEQVDLSVREAEASRSQVKAQLDLAQRNFERYQNLYENGAASRLEYENKQMEYERLRASYAAANASVDRSKANLSNVDVQRSQEDMLAAQANLKSATAALQQAQVNLEHTEIRSPIDGVVLSRNIEHGQTVAASFQTPILFTIANDLTQMEIEASVDESDIGFIQTGQVVSFTVDAFGQETFQGEVQEVRLQPKVISNVVIYTVIISAQNENQRLMPGMTANLDVVTEQVEDAVLVPIAALNFQPSNVGDFNWQGQLTSNTNSYDRSGVVWQLDQGELKPLRVGILLNNGRWVAIDSPTVKSGIELVIGEEQAERRKSEEKEAQSPFMPSLPGSNKNQAS
ncbi:MAG: efflux RND transporter periplasmic adaptor subunit [Bacteroidota bacterium]